MQKLIRLNPILLLAVLFFASCKKDDPVVFDQDFTGIYFQTDSINYSFSVTPLEEQTYLLKVPVQIMGSPKPADRVFAADIIAEKTTAVAGVHYQIEGNLNLPKDSINGYIPVLINRSSLQDKDFRIHFKLTQQNGFSPVNEQFKEAIVVFNNRVEPPQWKDWAGRPTWPTTYLGQWNPLTYVKFIELFRALEDKVPETYTAMVKLYGQDLKNVTSGWPFDYQNTMTKYVLIPLYQYFVEQHPELGVTIPRPRGY